MTTKMPQPGADNCDRLYKIRPLLKKLQERFEDVYSPQLEVAVDESLLLWKRATGFSTAHATKESEVWHQTFLVCDRTGYTHRFRVYQGQSTQSQAWYITYHQTASI